MAGTDDSRTDPVRIVMVDNHALVRTGLRRIIEDCWGFRVVGEAGTAAEALALLDGARPELVTVDIGVPDLDGLDLIPMILRKCPAAGVVVVANHYGPSDLRRALRSGARGYVTKADRTEVLRLALSAAARGESFLSPRITSLVIDELCRGKEVSAPSVEGGADIGTA